MQQIEILIRNAHKLGVNPVSGKYLWENQDELLSQFDKESFFQEKTQTLKKYGETLESWEYLMTYAHSLMFSPTEKQAQANQEIKALCRKYEIINPIRQQNYLYALLSNVNPKRVKRFKINGVYHYQITNP